MGERIGLVRVDGENEGLVGTSGGGGGAGRRGGNDHNTFFSFLLPTPPGEIPRIPIFS